MVELLRRLDRAQFISFVYAFHDGPLSTAIRRMDIPIVIGTPRAAGRAWTKADAAAKISFRKRLAGRMRSDRIDVCLVYSWADALPAAREAGIAAIVERVDGPKLIGWVRDKSSCQRIICESDSIARLVRAQSEWLRCASVPIVVIRNGIDRMRFDPGKYDRVSSRRTLGLKPQDFVVGAVARLAPVKNLSHLLEAGKLLLDRIGSQVKVQFVLAGPDGGDLAALRRQARELGIARCVRFLGARTDVPRVLNAFDVFALTSIQEGMPFALLEAMAMGLPIVASQSDSIAESVQDNAFLVGPLDPYRTMLALRHLLFNDALRRGMGRRSLRQAAKYDLATMIRGYERTLRAAFREGRRTRPFRRRIAVVPGHPGPGHGRARSIDVLFTHLLARGVDAYMLRVGSADAKTGLRWPPPRRQSFPFTTEGRLARKGALEWIQPDVIVTDCPRVVEIARARLPGEEVVFMPEPSDRCPGYRHALRTADRILLEGKADVASHRERWPQTASRLWTLSARENDPAEALCNLLVRYPRSLDS